MELNREKDSLLKSGIKNAIDTVAHPADDSSSSFRNELAGYLAQFAKTVPLFLPSISRRAAAVGYGAAAVLAGLDEAKQGDALSDQLNDFALGAGKGALTKGSFDLLGRVNFSGVNGLVEAGLAPKFLSGKPLEISAKAMSFGISSRLIDGGLTRQSYLDENREFSLSRGLYNTASGAVNLPALATDIAVFSGSALIMKSANVLTRGLLERSTVMQTISTGASFGFLSGSSAEAQRQYQSGHYDLGEIVYRGTLEGLSSGLAAAPGGIIASRHISRQAQAQNEAGLSPEKIVSAQAETVSPKEVPLDSNVARAMNEPVSITEQIDGIGIVSRSPMKFNLANDNAPVKANLIESLVAKKIGENNRPEEGALNGAKQYETEKGKFWQLEDGRIFSEKSVSEKRGANSIWVPYGSLESSGFMHRSAETAPFRVWSLQENYGKSVDSTGNRWNKLLGIGYDSAIVKAKSIDTYLALNMSAERMEQPWQAELRILPASSGQMYERTSLRMEHRAVTADAKPEDLPPLVKSNLNVRVYRIMSQEQTVELADRREQLKERTINQDTFDKFLSGLRERTQTIAVEETHAARLDELRDLRRTATLSPSMLPEIREQINEARRTLFTSPYRDHLLPEYFGQYLDRLPNRRLNQLLVLTDDSSLAYSASKDTLADATSSGGGRIRLFKESSQVFNEVPTVLNHEWTHLMQAEYPHTFAAYSQAIKLEPFVLRSYGKRNSSENWATSFGEAVLDPSPEYFLTLAEKAPIRTAIIGSALRASMAKAPESENSKGREELTRRLDYIDTEVLPKAVKSLNEKLASHKIQDVLESTSLVRMLYSSPESRAFAEKLVDKKALEAAADARPADGNFSRDVVARVVLSLELMKAVDPQSFALRARNYEKMVQLLNTYSVANILDPAMPYHKASLELAKALAEPGASKELAARLFPISALEQLAMNGSAPESAKTALELISPIHGTNEQYFASRRLALSNGPAQIMALRMLVNQDMPSWLLRGMPEIVSQLKVMKDPTPLQHLVLAQAKRLAANPNADHISKLAMQTLLERIAEKKPELYDDALRASYDAAKAQSKVDYRAWISDTKTFSAAASNLRVLGASGDPKLIAAARELMPEDLMIARLKERSKFSTEALDTIFKVNPDRAYELASNLVDTSSPVRTQAIGLLLGTKSPEYLLQARQHIENFSSWGTESDRIQLIGRINKLITVPEFSSALTRDFRNRTEMRIALGQRLMEPLQISLHANVIDDFNSSVKKFREAWQAKQTKNGMQ